VPQHIGALIIHGMGSQKPGYSRGLVERVSRLLGPRAARVSWEEIYWAPALAAREAELWQWMGRARAPDGSPLPLDGRGMREFIVHNFGDALAYHRDPDADIYADVHRIIHAGLRALKDRLGDPDAPIVVLAHSLGAHMISNYIWDRQRDAGAPDDPFEGIGSLAGFITFGANVPLFSLSYALAKPVLLPGASLTHPGIREAVRWLNFYDRDDVLGWPIKPLYLKNEWALSDAQKHTLSLIEDREINVGTIATSWNPASHGRYWTDDDFTAPVAAYLATLVAAADT
jgi:hypothetical protein